MFISFIIPSFNRRDVLRTVLTELRRYNQEIIVIDNGSKDGSPEMVRDEFPEVILIPNAHNAGCLARNQGLDIATGNYVVMMDDDSYPIGDSVEKAIKRLNADPGIGAIAFRTVFPNGGFETAGIYSAFIGCAVIFPRYVAERIKYPDDYLYYVEDYDVSLHVWSMGLRVATYKDLTFMHMKSPVSRDFGQVMMRLVRNNMILWTKYLPADLAKQQIDMELWRYKRICQKEGVIDSYLEGLIQGYESTVKYDDDRSHELSPEAARIVLGVYDIDLVAEDVARHHKRVLIFSVGKCVHWLIDALESRGVQIVGIADDNHCMHGNTIDGITVGRKSDFFGYEAIVIGSSCLTVNDTLEERLKGNIPVYRLVEYDE